MKEAELIATRLRTAVPHVCGTLRFWGEWFGGAYDNIHELIGCKVDGDCLRLYFDQGKPFRFGLLGKGQSMRPNFASSRPNGLVGNVFLRSIKVTRESILSRVRQERKRHCRVDKCGLVHATICARSFVGGCGDVVMNAASNPRLKTDVENACLKGSLFRHGLTAWR